MTKIFNFALKIKGGGREDGRCEVLQPCHPQKKNWNVHKAREMQKIQKQNHHMEENLQASTSTKNKRKEKIAISFSSTKIKHRDSTNEWAGD